MKKIFVLILFFVLVLPLDTFGADLFVSSSGKVFQLERDFIVDVSVNTKDQPVNAVEGEINFDSNFLNLKEVRDGSSVLNFWIDRPHLVGKNKIVFSGITTGGFNGPDMHLFSLVFTGKNIGQAIITVNNLKVLQNDGLGTNVATTITPLVVNISKDAPSSGVSDIEDQVPPEEFLPFVARDESLYDNKYFVVFSTTDKGIGIDHYEIREGYWGQFKNASSPYVLSDQSLIKNIYVKAIDKSQNEREEKINPQKRPIWLDMAIILAIILSIFIFVYKKYGKKYYKSFF